MGDYDKTTEKLVSVADQWMQAHDDEGCDICDEQNERDPEATEGWCDEMQAVLEMQMALAPERFE